VCHEEPVQGCDLASAGGREQVVFRSKGLQHE
jgi:hypothetical protein